MLLHSHAAHSILNKDSIKSALEGITFSCMDPKLTRKSLCFKINVFFFFSHHKSGICNSCLQKIYSFMFMVHSKCMVWLVWLSRGIWRAHLKQDIISKKIELEREAGKSTIKARQVEL